MFFCKISLQCAQAQKTSLKENNKKTPLSVVCSALVCSDVALANSPTENTTDLKDMQPFVGFMVGTID
ncbi:MAG: hypothetical protein SPJ83_02640 [Helicobacter sp.]|uniref:hypothetical protein n=1 Tax=Helicobacter sp. TaxID=218 RepID=UPI002A91D238|nr:hypothetical protein [Helicobacter sp.]MDY5821687.1 hypothetical protein [Helicobacter sp.]